ncbi:MAG: DUF4292 domain-containing protein [Cytophagales bacterium]|nr:DUF4292 domain-containing protein [Cytophagales bacterium]
MNRFWLFLLTILVCSCGKLLTSQGRRNISFAESLDHFSFQSRVKYTQGASSSFLGLVRWRGKKDSLLWASVAYEFPLEVLRLMFRTDSVFILNRLEKTYFAGPVDGTLQTWMGLSFPSPLQSFQAILWGRLPFPLDKFEEEREDDRQILRYEGSSYSFVCALEVDKLDGLLESEKRMSWWIVRDDRGRKLICDYTYKKVKKASYFSRRRKNSYPKEVLPVLSLRMFDSSRQLWVLDLKSKPVRLGPHLKYPFRVSGTYKQKP